MSASAWLVVHLVAVAALAGVGWVVQVVVYPAFPLVGPAEWAGYHARHQRAVGWVVAVPWVAQGASAVALLLTPPGEDRLGAVVLALLALVTVVATTMVALPAHGVLAAGGLGSGRAQVTLQRANLVRTLAWTASTGLAAALLL